MTGSAELRRLLAGPVLEAAPMLLDSVLTHGDVSVRISEVEAYDGMHDPGSHAFRGRTARNSTMFGPAGHLYVYFTYGMHHCCNVVTGPEGAASAVLLRAGEVLSGLELARERRNVVADRDLARGPARLCQALGLDLGHNGSDLTDGDPYLRLAAARERSAISCGPRVGLRHAADHPWRFWITDDPTVSAYRPASQRRAGR